MRDVVRKSRFFSIILFLTAFRLIGGDRAECHEPAAPGELLEKISETYKIQALAADRSFSVKTTHGEIACTAADGKLLPPYVRLFATEFFLYPGDLVKRSRLERVVLCSVLSYAGQSRNAIPDFEHDTLYLDVSRGADNKRYLRKVIHHEFFHLIDYRDDGRVYQDERWASLNPVNVKYGQGGKAVQELAETSVLTDKFPGFLNHYSTTGVEEDKAEIFANLIVNFEYVAARAEEDPVLDSKMRQMKELLATFCPAMNDEFWERARKTKRDDM